MNGSEDTCTMSSSINLQDNSAQMYNFLMFEFVFLMIHQLFPLFQVTDIKCYVFKLKALTYNYY